MKRIAPIILLLLTVLSGCKNSTSELPEKAPELPEAVAEPQPRVSFTFDDGITADLAGLKFEQWNQMILSHLEKEDLKAVFFVTGSNKSDQNGKFLLNSWNNAGHKIANHIFSSKL